MQKRPLLLNCIFVKRVEMMHCFCGLDNSHHHTYYCVCVCVGVSVYVCVCECV